MFYDSHFEDIDFSYEHEIEAFSQGEGSEGNRFEKVSFSPGILPEARSTTCGDRKELQVLWQLPGHGVAYGDCGQKRYRGCLNVEGHTQSALDVDTEGKAYVEWYLRSCGRLECPTCYEKAASAEAHKIEYRLKSVGRSMGAVIHLIISPPKSDWGLSFTKLRAKMYKIARKAGFRGGSAIFHPFRKHPRKGWFFSAHFHLIGYGWIVWDESLFRETGWVVKNRGIRKSVAATAFYQISHCGLTVQKKQSFDNRNYRAVHSITWFGKLAYNKLRIPKEVIEEHVCPLCKEKLVPLLHFGPEELQGDEGSGWFDADSFCPKTRWGPGG